MGVIGGNIVLLRDRHVHPAPGQEEELDDADVRRQLAVAQRLGIGEIGITAKEPVDHRCDEARLQQVAGFRLLQRQRREEGEFDGTVGCGARIERVDDVIGLAEPERQADHELVADVADDLLRNRIRIAEHHWHRETASQDRSVPESERSPS